MGDLLPVRPATTPLCEACEIRPAEVLAIVGDEGFRVCVECAADGVRANRAEVRL